MNGSSSDFGTPEGYIQTWDGAISNKFNFCNAKPTASEGSDAPISAEQLVDWLLQNQMMPVDMKQTLTAAKASGNLSVASAPGRLDLIGGIADNSGSLVVQYLTSPRTFSIVYFSSSTEASINMLSYVLPSLRDVSARKANSAEQIWHKRLDNKVLFERSHSPHVVSERELSSRIRSGKFDLTDKSLKFSEGPETWSLYVTGTLRAACLLHERNTMIGMDLSTLSINVILISDIAPNVGIASSAATEMSVMLAASAAINQHSKVWSEPQQSRLFPSDRTQYAFAGKAVENEVVGVPTGIMDQLTIMNGEQKHLYVLNCTAATANESDTLSSNVPLPDGLEVIGLISGVTRAAGADQYSTIMTATRIGEGIIRSHRGDSFPSRPCSLSLQQFEREYEQLLPVSLTGDEVIELQRQGKVPRDGIAADPGLVYPIRAAFKHPIKVNLRANILRSLLRNSNGGELHDEELQVLAELLFHCHRDYQIIGLNCSRTDLLVDLVFQESILRNKNNDFIGAKSSGGGRGGTVVAMIKSSITSQTDESIERVRSKYFEATGLKCGLVRGSSDKARIESQCRMFSSQSRRDYNDRPRVLLVNHGYPPQFNGGSENYTKLLAHSLARSGLVESVVVFAREHDPFSPDFSRRVVIDQAKEGDVKLTMHMVNVAREAPYFRFEAVPLDEQFETVLRETQPQIVHFGHLNHLSTNLPAIAKRFKAKVVYTLHDYWLICPRGQFIMTGMSPAKATKNGDVWPQCDGQNDSKCAVNCFSSRYSTGISSTEDDELVYWTQWVSKRMQAVRAAQSHVDAFIAPSTHLLQRFQRESDIPRSKLNYIPYGFERDLLRGRSRSRGESNAEPFVFAYIGRHQPSKGLHLIVQAALRLLEGGPENASKFRVLLFGRADASIKSSLNRMIASSPLASATKDMFRWCPEYQNENIVREVFNNVDAIIVPSLWY